jgi:hypothetical protein
MSFVELFDAGLGFEEGTKIKENQGENFRNGTHHVNPHVTGCPREKARAEPAQGPAGRPRLWPAGHLGQPLRPIFSRAQVQGRHARPGEVGKREAPQP